MKSFDILNKMPESYWLASTEKTDFPKLDENLHVDIAIVGGGMVGILTGYQLESTNLNIAILEAERVAESTSAHTTAKLTSQHDLIYYKIKKQMGLDLAAQYANANERAIHEIKKVADENNIDCDYSPQSAYIFTQEDKYIRKIEDEFKTVTSLEIKAELIDRLPLPIDIKSGLEFKNQAQFHPRKFLIPLARKIHNNIRIYEKTRAIELNKENDKYIIGTDQGKTITADRVIIASHYPFYNKRGMYYSKIYVERSYAIAFKAREKFPGGIYINTDLPTRSLRSLPTEDGELILLVGENHKTGQGQDMNNHYQALFNFAQELFTVEDVLYRWSTQDCMTMDSIPYIGQYAKDTPNLYIATGFQKWGMTTSMAASMILKDLLIKGESPWMDVFNPSRKNISGAAKEFLVQNTNLAGQLLDGKTSKYPKKTIIEKGQGRILDVDGKRTGAYRDEEGNLHFVNTTCTHMGCELNWNSAERSWDCPCHGSRFTYRGDIIQGPAVKPLGFDRDVNTLKKLLGEDF